MSFDTRFSRKTTRLTSWPDEEHYSCPLQSLVVSLSLSLLFLVSSLFFSRTKGVLSHQKSLTHRFPRFPPRNLCSLVTLAVFFSRLRCNGHSFMLSSYRESILNRLRTLVPGHLSSHFHCPAADSAPLGFCQFFVSTTSGPGPGKLPGF